MNYKILDFCLYLVGIWYIFLGLLLCLIVLFLIGYFVVVLIGFVVVLFDWCIVRFKLLCIIIVWLCVLVLLFCIVDFVVKIYFIVCVVLVCVILSGYVWINRIRVDYSVIKYSYGKIYLVCKFVIWYWYIYGVICISIYSRGS